jgi:hypothetical protein
VQEGSEPTQVSRGSGLDDTIAAQPDAVEVLDAIRDLSARVGGLQADVNALRTQAHPLPTGGSDALGWDGRPQGSRDTLAWVRDLESPRSRRANVPWLLLEITFLAAAAVGAAVADLDWVAIVAVMAGAWALVALGEWAAALSARRRAEAVFAPPTTYGPGFASDPSWFAPPVERTVLDAGDEDTGARLPPPTGD